MRPRPSSARLLAAGAVLALTAAACGGSSDSGGGGGTENIRISEVVMLTGNVGFFGTELDRGAKIAMDKVNGDGGIDGAKLEVKKYDTASDKDKAVRLSSDAINDDDSPALLAMTTTTDQLAWVPDVQDAEMPLLSNSVAAQIPAVGDKIFQVAPPDSTLIPNFVTAVTQQLNIKKVAFLHVSGDASVDASTKSFKEAFAAAGVQAVSDQQYLHSDTTWTTQLIKAKGADPDAMVIVPYAQEGGSMLKEARQVGLDLPIIGGSPFNSTDALKQAGAAGDDLYVPDFWFATDGSPENEYFTTQYRKLFNQEPTRFAATGYNQMRLLADALKKADDPRDRASVAEALASIPSFHYVGCNFTFKDRVPVCDKPVVLRSKDGAFSPAV